MTLKFRALWQTLLAATDPAEAAPLTCDECFEILEYMADVAAAGANDGRLRQALRKHMAHCSDCREHHLRRLRELEELPPRV